MAVPTGPEAGEKPEIAGVIFLELTEKFELLVAVPAGLVTEIFPEVAPLGTPVTMAAFEITVKGALTPLNLTCEVPEKLKPVMVTAVPILPEEGVKLVMAGAVCTTVTVKLLLLVAVPPGVVTLILPVVAPDGTVAVIWVPETTVNDGALVPLKLTAVAPDKFIPLIVRPCLSIRSQG